MHNNEIPYSYIELGVFSSQENQGGINDCEESLKQCHILPEMCHCGMVILITNKIKPARAWWTLLDSPLLFQLSFTVWLRGA